MELVYFDSNIPNIQILGEAIPNVPQKYLKSNLIYQAVHPPSTIRLAPVMYLDASDMRYKIAPW